MDWLEGRWEFTIDGVVSQEGSIPSLSIVPGFTEEVKLDIKHPNLTFGQECHLNIHYCTKEATVWCDAGHEVAWEQFELKYTPKSSSKPQPDTTQTVLTCAVGDGAVIIKNYGN